MKNRADRRKDPDQWWEVAAFATKDRAMPVDEGLPSVYLKGDVQGATVVQLPPELSAMDPASQEAFMEGVKETLAGAGIDRAVIMPSNVRFLRLVPVTPAKSKELNRGMKRTENEKKVMH